MKRALVVVAILGCKKSEPVPTASPPKPVEASDFRAKHTLTAAAKGSAFELTDGTGQFHVTLPNEPKLSADMMEQSGVQMWNAQAVMPGGDVDVQFGAMTVPDGDLPADPISSIESVPTQLAAATGGTVAKNQSGTLAGLPVRVFELVLGDKRRMFGWYLIDHPDARVFQINCVGIDTDKTRTACTAVATSFRH
jgi:hypothetical protein